MSLPTQETTREYVVWIPSDDKDNYSLTVDVNTPMMTTKILSDNYPGKNTVPTEELLIDPSSISRLKDNHSETNVPNPSTQHGLIQSSIEEKHSQTFISMVSDRDSEKIIASLSDLQTFTMEELGKTWRSNNDSRKNVSEVVSKNDPSLGKLIYDAFHTHHFEFLPSENDDETTKSNEKWKETDELIIYLPNEDHLKAWLLSRLLGKNTPNFPDVLSVSVSVDANDNYSRSADTEDDVGNAVRSLMYYEPVTTLKSKKRIPRNMTDVARIFFESTFAALRSIQNGISMIDYDEFSVGKRHNPRKPVEVYKRAYNIDGVYYMIDNRANFGGKGKTDVIYKPRVDGFILEENAKLITDTPLRVLSRIIPGKGGIYNPRRSSTSCADTKLVRDASKIDAGAIELWYLGIHLFNLCTGIRLIHPSLSSQSSSSGDTSGYSALLHCLKIRKLLDPKGFHEFINNPTNDFTDTLLWKKMVSSYSDGSETFSFDLFKRESRKRLRKNLTKLGITPLILQLTHYNPRHRFVSPAGYRVSNGPLVSQESIDTIISIFSHKIFKQFRVRQKIDTFTASGRENLEYMHGNPSIEWFWSNDKLELSEIESIIDALTKHTEEQKNHNTQASVLKSHESISSGTRRDMGNNVSTTSGSDGNVPESLNKNEKIAGRYCATGKGSGHHHRQNETATSCRYPVAKTICSFCGYYEILKESKQCNSPKCELSGRVYCANDNCHKSDLLNYRKNMGTIKMATMKF